MNLLSFTNDDFELILKHSGTLFPGVLKLIAIYYEAGSDTLVSRIIDSPNGGNRIKDYSIVDSRDVILKLRTESLKYNWYKEHELPFDSPEDKQEIRDIFSESDNTVLLLRFRNPSDGLYDLMFVYFKPNISNFRLSRDDKPLSAENKSIIAGMLHNFLEFTFEQNRKNRSTFKALNRNTKALMNEAEGLKRELSITRYNYADSLSSLCIQYLNELSAQHGKDYSFADDALHKLRMFKGNINHLKTIIEESVMFASSLGFDDESNKVEITSWHINTDSYTQTNTEKKAFTIDSKYEKTINLLDKYENAAQLLMTRNEPLTGARLGMACETPISAPAITDSLKKHRTKILYLFDKYPEKWEVIRREFRPVRNISG